MINLDPTVGAEIKKTRPAIIVNNDALGKLPIKIIVPLTDWKDKFKMAPWLIKIEPDRENSLSKVSGADCFQISSVSHERCVKLIGTFPDTLMEEIRTGLAKILSIDSE